MKTCSKVCEKNNTGCPVEDCRHWINYEEDNNCCLISIEKNGPMKLRQVADRIGVSYVRIKHIQDAALLKLSKSNKKEDLLCILPD